jgi:hypothetical protein
MVDACGTSDANQRIVGIDGNEAAASMGVDEFKTSRYSVRS